MRVEMLEHFMARLPLWLTIVLVVGAVAYVAWLDGQGMAALDAIWREHQVVPR